MKLLTFLTKQKKKKRMRSDSYQQEVFRVGRAQFEKLVRRDVSVRLVIQ
jgi:hypothetical protein